MTCMAQHFEILQQHTAYRRRLSVAPTVRMPRAAGRRGGQRRHGRLELALGLTMLCT